MSSLFSPQKLSKFKSLNQLEPPCFDPSDREVAVKVDHHIARASKAFGCLRIPNLSSLTKILTLSTKCNAAYSFCQNLEKN